MDTQYKGGRVHTAIREELAGVRRTGDVIAATLPGQRREVAPRRALRDPVGVSDVAHLLHALSGQVVDVAEHFEQVGRHKESLALTRVAIELDARALWIAMSGTVATMKSMASIVTSLRSSGLIERDTLRSMRKVLSGETPSHEDMRRLVTLVRIPLLPEDTI